MWFAEQPLQIGLLEDRVVVRRAGRRADTAEELPVTAAPQSGQAPWQPALQTLAQWLEQQALGPVKAEVRLGSAFVRWQLLDWAAPLQQPQELQAYAQMQMRATFGAVAQAWRVVHGQASPGHALPACAADQGLGDALQALQGSHGLGIRSLAPYFSVAFDHWRGRLPRRGGWFGVVEPRALTLGLHHEGQWRGLRSQRLSDAGVQPWEPALTPIKAQLALAAGVPEAQEWPLHLAGCVQAPVVQTRLSWLAPAQRADDHPIQRLAWGV